MRILLYDDYTAGAEPVDALEAAQVDVHRALVAALAVDFGRLNAHEVRVAAPPSAASDASDLAWAEAAVLLAPETHDRLTVLAESFEASDVRLLGPDAAAIRLVSDRHGMALALAEAGLPAPRSWAIDGDRLNLLQRVTARLGYPVVVKPLTGAGGRGVRLVRADSEMSEALAAVDAVAGNGVIVLQEHVSGLAAGVGLVVAGGAAQPLALWGALLSAPPAMIVERCATPLDHPGVEAAVDLAVRAARAIPGLRGYVEVDLVLGERGPVLLEIAARPTLGALALRRSRQINLAALIVDACLHERLPDMRFWPPAQPVLVDLDHPAAALAAAVPFI
ncbi:MAG: ATP-grasp domain-containing protein [Chloroflexi bacterium]|nr:ATP-grasp domain-containing protein [Chloroflexota bacterium]